VGLIAKIEVPERLDVFETGSFLFSIDWLAEEYATPLSRAV